MQSELHGVAIRRRSLLAGILFSWFEYPKVGGRCHGISGSSFCTLALSASKTDKEDLHARGLMWSGVQGLSTPDRQRTLRMFEPHAELVALKALL